MKKKILIHSLVFSPDSVSTAYLYNDIAIGLKDAGYDVVVLTTTPHYNLIAEVIEKQPLLKRLGGLYYISDFKGIKVYHVTQRKFKSLPARIFGFLYWHILSFFIGICEKDISLILSPSPPLTIGFLSLIIAKLKGAKVVYNVQEIYPDFLINQGNIRSKLLITILKSLERVVYNYSDLVTTIDQVFYDTICDRFKNRAKLIIIPNFVDTDVYYPRESNSLNINTTLFPVENSIKLMYAGNIGHAQDWEPLLYIADKFRNNNVSFWVIGEGVLKDELIIKIRELKLNNIHLLPYQSRHSIPDILCYADIHFIFMNAKMDGQGFPSKVYSIMACKKPLLVISRKKTPLSNFLHDKDCAFVISEDSHDKVLEKLYAIMQNFIQNADVQLLERYGSNGLSLIQQSYSSKSVVKKYIEVANKLIN